MRTDCGSQSAMTNGIDMNNVTEEIKENGFATLKSFFSRGELEILETAVLELYSVQAEKIGEYRADALKVRESGKSNFEKFAAIYEMMEANDKEALYQVQRFLAGSAPARSIFGERFLQVCADVLGSNKYRLLIDGPGIFINRPGTERLLYKWHSEAHYYPKRRRFLNIWFPLFDDKSKANGTMSFKVGSHKRDFPFSDYQGYNKDTEKKSNYFIQYEIPENFLTEYKEHWCETKTGDLLVFDKGLVHRSNANKSDKYSVAVVARVWDPTDDLTLSGTIVATPYGGNVGRSNLVVNPDE